MDREEGERVSGTFDGWFQDYERVDGREDGGGHKGVQKSRFGLVHGRKEHELFELG